MGWPERVTINNGEIWEQCFDILEWADYWRRLNGPGLFTDEEFRNYNLGMDKLTWDEVSKLDLPPWMQWYVYHAFCGGKFVTKHTRRLGPRVVCTCGEDRPND